MQILRKFVSRGLTQTLVLAKKVCDEKRKKETKIKKTTGALYKLSQRSERRRLPLKQGVLDHFIVGDIDSV